MSTQQQTRPGEGNTNGNKTNSTVTCIVGCKLPSGFLMEFGSEEKGDYRSLKLNGMNTTEIINGFGITRGVPVDLYDAWAKKHEKRAMMKNGLIFKVDGKDDANVNAISKELKGQKTKLEPLSQRKLPKGVKPLDREE